MTAKTSIGQNLRKARLERDMTQAQVAKAVDLHPNFYARVERSEEATSVKTLKAICKVLKIKSSEVLDF